MTLSIDFANHNRLTDFTTEVNRFDNLYDYTGVVAKFTERTTDSTNITFDLTDKNIIVPQSVSRGSKSFMKGREKSVKPISIFLDYIRLDDNITKDDFLDYRLPASTGEMDSLTAVRLDKLSGLQNNVAQAIEFQKLSAMTGVSKTAYGDVLFDGYAATGTTQQEVDFVLGTSSTEVGIKINEAVKKSADKFKTGGIMPMPVAFVGDTFFDKLISQATVKDAYAQYASVQEPLRNSQVELQKFGSILTFRHKNVLFINYNPTFTILSADGYGTDTAKAFGDNEGFLLPTSANDFLRSYWGQSQKLNKSGGAKMHASEYMSEDMETWNMTVESAGLHFCTNPEAIVKLTTSN